MVVGNRRQAGVGSEDPERELDEALPLARLQAAAFAWAHSLLAQALCLRLEARAQLARTDAAVAFGAGDDQGRRRRRERRARADLLDHRHARASPASRRMRART